MLVFLWALLVILLAFLGLTVRNLRDYRPADSEYCGVEPLVTVCLPARNEEKNIEECLRALLAQRYPRFEVQVLDDESQDGTAEIVQRIAEEDGRVRLLRGRPILTGWAGKCHACAQLAETARGDYLLFLDADTRAEPSLVGSLVSVAEKSGADLVSGFPRQETGTLSEALALPLLHFLVLTLLPVRRVWESAHPAFTAACGQLLLFRRESYLRIGGHGAVRASFHDGLQLARRMKARGGRVFLFDASPVMRCRMYEGAAAVWNGFTRNAYEGLGSVGALLAITLLVGGVFLSPFVLVGVGCSSGAAWTWLAAACAAVVLSIRSLQAARFGGWISVVLTPVSLLLLLSVQWASALRALRCGAFTWRGRAYA